MLVERYESEIEILNSQEQSYQFEDQRAYLESLPSPKKEEIPMPFEVQEEDDQVFKSHTEDAVEDAEIKASRDEDNLPVMGGLKEESVHHVFIDLVAEYMEALVSSDSPAWILRRGQIHQEWSPLMVASVLKTHMQSTLWLSLTGS